ncbi:bifunctional glutamate N-acetyltransferase/amino-acid acetyltransferase ArgJ [Kineosporia succinea]|uniref:Arginine biosynthesis bifunctional protein ArgJ n=1 Tax=Kineosporia succinea TaxID=84632 RepID=A0ABT9P6M8_9ACTN|nr:bifunctional glutamate N-acetyltransferase/amino-acid acetyltransferase ArgJ [Kineosporia succinea]MDP9828338.1 glutamate N-acetyltransferase/amino-acid N-acetyltransferase [Kineosporia succinea]
MSVTTAKGFRAAGVAAGLKSTGAPDVALVVNDGPNDAAAAVFTSNRCKANPVLWSERAIADGRLRAVVLNSGGANCYTGSEGFQVTHATAEEVARLSSLSPFDVLVCSTGLIGLNLPKDRMLKGVADATAQLRADGGTEAATAIMTTDTVSKEAAVTSPAGWTVGGMAKGAGMLAPALATMLVVVTTDAEVSPEGLDRALRKATRVTFDRLDSDGCQSTNDTVVLMSSGACGVEPDEAEFTAAVTEVCKSLALQLLGDAEGADHDIAIEVLGAVSEEEAVEVGRSVARSNLFKAAIFGKDPNWGRILASVGTTRAQFDPADLDVALNGTWVCRKSTPAESAEGIDLTDRQVSVTIDLKSGPATATVWTNDLTHAYVHENSAYSS